MQTVVSDEATVVRGGKYLTFFLGDEEYGLEILKAQEIIGLMDITPVPRTPACVRGVINLRGRVIPVVQLRVKFGMNTVEETNETCIIVVQVNGTPVGLVVDRVSEVTNIREDAIEPPPEFGADVDTAYILGIGKSDGRVRMLLDIDQVLGVSGVASLGEA